MSSLNTALTAICIVLVFVGAPGDQPHTREVTFEQIRPYVVSLVCADTPCGELRIANPLLLDVRQRLARRSLTDIELLTMTWKAYTAVMEKSTATSTESAGAPDVPGWCSTWEAAYVQASDELGGVLTTVEDDRDYFDLLDLHISQILSRDVGFLAPLLQELATLLDNAETPVTCTDCQTEFIRWLEDLRRRP